MAQQRQDSGVEVEVQAGMAEAVEQADTVAVVEVPQDTRAQETVEPAVKAQ